MQSPLAGGSAESKSQAGKPRGNWLGWPRNMLMGMVEVADIISKPRDLSEIEVLKEILGVLRNAGCPENVLLPLEQWVFDLMTDKTKYDNWIKHSRQNNQGRIDG